MINPHNHIGLVNHICRRYFKIIPPSDKLGAGYFGLVEAAKRFNPSLGYQFSTYACQYIKGALYHWLPTEYFSCISIPRYHWDVYWPHYYKGLSWRKYLRERKVPYSVSMECIYELEPIDNTFETVEKNENSRGAYQYLFSLPSKWRMLMAIYYGLIDGLPGGNLSSIGKLMGFSREYARQIRDSALERLQVCAKRCFLDGKRNPFTKVRMCRTCDWPRPFKHQK